MSPALSLDDVAVAAPSGRPIVEQVKLGRLKVIPLKGMLIERTLWQLKSPGRIDSPAASAFRQVLANGRLAA